MKLRALLLAAVVAFGLPVAAFAGGMFQGYPAATSITGNECIPADTNLTQGLTPQTECVDPTLLLSGSGTTVLTDAVSGTVTPTLTGNNVFTLLAAGTSSSRTMANISGAIVGARVVFVVTQGGGGSNLITWGTMYGWAGSTAPTLSTAAGKSDVITCTVITSALASCAASLDVRH